MKSLPDKIDDLLNEIIYLDFKKEIDVDKAKKAIRFALKKQDRDTRHACAEAIMRCEENISGECIRKDNAHNACMNSRAI